MLPRNLSSRSLRIATNSLDLPNTIIYSGTLFSWTRAPQGPNANTRSYWSWFGPRVYMWIFRHRVAINDVLEPRFGRKISGSIGRSMYPTLTGVNELTLTDTRYQGGVGIRVGDVVSVWHPHKPGDSLGKRVKGLEGHTYTKKLRGLGIEKVVVPEGYCKVEGDNKNNSSDSRQFGSVPLANIRGKIIWRWGPGGFWKISNSDTNWKIEFQRSRSPLEAVVKLAKRLGLGILPAPRTRTLVPKAPKNAPVISSTRSRALVPSPPNKDSIKPSVSSKGSIPNIPRKGSVISPTQSRAVVPKALKKASVVSSAKSKANESATRPLVPTYKP